MAYQPRTSGGGTSTPGLPVWTFAAADSSDPASGRFTTDNANPSSITTLNISVLPKNNGSVSMSGLLGGLALAYMMLFTDSTGKTYVFSASGPGTFEGDFYTFSVTPVVFDAQPLVGPYQVSFAPQSFQIIPTLGQVLSTSGITPVADGTVTPITSESTVSGIVTALS